MARSTSPRFWLYPATVWLVVLATIFVTEYVVMLVLPSMLPGQYPRFLEAAVDAVTLIAVLSPVIWWTVLRPLQEVIRLRTQFLTDLFARIEADRRRIAYELHDGVGQSLSLLVSGLRSAHETMADPEVARRCEQLRQLTQTALQEVKQLARGLRPSLLDDLGLGPALERLVADVREHHGVELTLDTGNLADSRLPESVETTVFRIVQEALANVVTHAHARTVAVTVHRSQGTLTVRVADDGMGMELSAVKTTTPGHLGLIGMRERATLLGGSFHLDSAPGRGTRVTVTIPIGE